MPKETVHPVARPSRFTEDIENAYTRFDSVDHERNTIEEISNLLPGKPASQGGIMAVIKAKLLSIGDCIKNLMRRTKRERQVDGNNEPKEH